ncbi:hypothetical protein GZ77_21245 [Endozoicomonas montiporae]|uniref:Uncharacterized protein n=2 Tax=Endozoicomonas montiporae TaxID=1027273 RepID=A0A081N3D4_9GAMM|nr:hypothetical protein [Endozoicomonas montiporae]AMO58257.1 hypothetical protein EZMO1_4340 [Endozoicomonas montiporae CL-33]KEQ12957.1 hypothetical protein GZ77_21245 [Endozoicomonas montiporae]
MSTRSRIAIAEKNEAGIITYRSVYVHFDGDLVNETLTKHYNSQKLAEQIVKHGDISSITEGEIKRYRDYGDAWVTIRPRLSCNMEQLIKITKENDGQYLNVYQAGEWKEYRL